MKNGEIHGKVIARWTSPRTGSVCHTSMMMYRMDYDRDLIADFSEAGGYGYDKFAQTMKYILRGIGLLRSGRRHTGASLEDSSSKSWNVSHSNPEGTECYRLVLTAGNRFILSVWTHGSVRNVMDDGLRCLSQDRREKMLRRDCPLCITEHPPLQRNALRVEAIINTEFCTAKLKPGAERLNPARWICSGGSPISVYRPCSGDPFECHLWQQSNHGYMGTSKVIYCRKCQSRLHGDTECFHDNIEVILCHECGTLHVAYNTIPKSGGTK